MRKSLKNILAILFVCLLSYQLFAVDGVVTYVKGKVEVKRGSGWVSLKVGDKVAQSEMINTGFQSEAKIKLMDSVLYLGPVTRVTLDKLSSSSDKDKVNVYLSTGSVRSKVNHTDNKRVSYSVRTPIAVASVRGTDFIADDSNNFSCSDGAVAVMPVRYLIDVIRDVKSGKSDVLDINDISNIDDAGDLENMNEDDFNKVNEKYLDDLEEAKKKQENSEEPEHKDDAYDPNRIYLSGLDYGDITDLAAFEDSNDVSDLGVVVYSNKLIRVVTAGTMGTPKHNIEQKALDIVAGITTEGLKQSSDAPGPVSTSVSNAIASGNVGGPKTGAMNINVREPTGDVVVECFLPGL